MGYTKFNPGGGVGPEAGFFLGKIRGDGGVYWGESRPSAREWVGGGARARAGVSAS